MLYITVEMHNMTVYTVVQHLCGGPALLVANTNMLKRILLYLLFLCEIKGAS